MPSLRVHQARLPSRRLWVLGAVRVGAAVRGATVRGTAVRGTDVNPPGDDGEQPDTLCDAVCDLRRCASVKGGSGSCCGRVLCFRAAVDGGG